MLYYRFLEKLRINDVSLNFDYSKSVSIMDNKRFLKKKGDKFFGWIMSCFVLLCSFEIVFAQNKQPNIIFICTDDQAEWTVGASGNTEAVTPTLDRLAEEGAYLSNTFVTTPVCSPARATIFTSRYASEVNIPDFIVQPGHMLYSEQKGKVGLDPGALTFVELLRKAGYATGLVGKWHVGGWTEDPSRRFHPTHYGFEYFMGMTGGGTSATDAPLEEDGIVSKQVGFTDDILTEKAIRYVRDHKDQPFFLCLMYRNPHTPWNPAPTEDRAVYAGKDLTIPHLDYPDIDTLRLKGMMEDYMVNVASVDRNVGDVMEELERQGISENTIVIFTSDNGFSMGHNGIWHKGNGLWATRTLPPSTENIDGKYRPNLYDNSIKVPGIVWWPGVIRPGQRISHTVSNLDWFPTILQMAGVRSSVPKGVRGRSIVPLLRGDAVKDWDNDIYTEYSMINYCRALMRSYRTPEWKLVRDFLNPERDELYDLKNDPEERNNLVRSNDRQVKAIIKGLDKKLRNKMQEIDDPLLKAVKKNDFTEYLNSIH